MAMAYLSLQVAVDIPLTQYDSKTSIGAELSMKNMSDN
jgi:hypothetical protein